MYCPCEFLLHGTLCNFNTVGFITNCMFLEQKDDTWNHHDQSKLPESDNSNQPRKNDNKSKNKKK